MKTEIGKGLFLPNIYQTNTVKTPRSNEELIGEFLEWKRTYTKWAFDRYRVWVTRFQEFVDRPPEALVARDYVAFADWVGENFSPKSCQYALTIVRNYLQFQRDFGRLRFPLTLIRVPRCRSESHYCVTAKECDAMLDVARRRSDFIGVRNLLILCMLRDTGMRVGELCSLDVEQVKARCEAVIETEKNLRLRRVFWSGETETVLRRYLAVREDSPGGPGTPALLVAARGGRLSSRGVERVIEQLRELAGLEAHIVPHSFRHAFVHRMARKGVPDAVIAGMLGHVSTDTIRHYTSLSRGESKYYFYAEKLAA